MVPVYPCRCDGVKGAGPAELDDGVDHWADEGIAVLTKFGERSLGEGGLLRLAIEYGLHPKLLIEELFHLGRGARVELPIENSVEEVLPVDHRLD